MNGLETKSVESMSAREIKEKLSEMKVDFSDCFEKGDLVRKLNAHLEKKNLEQVLQSKELANRAYQRGGYPLAIRHYTDALALCRPADSEVVAQLLSNRSLTLLRMDQVSLARMDAERCVQTAPRFVKGHLRLGSALLRQGRAAEAVAALEEGLRLLAGDAAGGDAEGTGGEAERAGGDAAAAEARLRLEFRARLEEAAAALAAAGDAGRDPGADGGLPGPATECPLLEALSEDLLAEMMGRFLGPGDVCRAARTCRSLRHVCVLSAERTQKLWQGVAERAFAAAAAAYGAEHREWRALCIERQAVAARWRGGLAQCRVEALPRDPAEPAAHVFNVQKQGTVVASAEDGLVKIWDTAHMRCERTLPCATGGHKMVLGLWLEPDRQRGAQRCLSGGADGDIKVWDIARGVCLRVLAGHQGPVVSIVGSEERIYSTSFDSTCRVWGWGGRMEATLVGHSGHVCGLCLEGEEASGGAGRPGALWTGADDGLVKRWDVSSGACVETLPQQEGSVWCVQAGWRGAVVSGSTDAAVRAWDVRAPPAAALVGVMQGHTDAVAGCAVDDERIVTSAFDGTVRVWDWRTWRCRGVVDLNHTSVPGGAGAGAGQRRCTRLSLDDTQVVVGCIDGFVLVIHVL